MTPPASPRRRAVLVWLGVTAATGATLALVVGGFRPPTTTGPDAVSDLLLLACCAGAAAAALWLWWVTTCVVAEVLGGRTPASHGWVRRSILIACGVVALSGVTGAHAAPSLDGLPLPDRSTSPATAEADTRPTQTVAAPVVERVTVLPGDTLWSLARARLGARADDADVATYVAALHAHNHDVIGTDPDLIRPGQVLGLPARP